jgi:hypothetical protein
VSDNDNPLAGCIVALAAIAASPFICMLHGWYTMLLWRWFIPAPPITWHAAVGMSLVIAFVKIRNVEGAGKSPTEVIKSIVAVQISLALAVFIGWLFWLCGFGNQP